MFVWFIHNMIIFLWLKLIFVHFINVLCIFIYFTRPFLFLFFSLQRVARNIFGVMCNIHAPSYRLHDDHENSKSLKYDLGIVVITLKNWKIGSRDESDRWKTIRIYK